MSGLSNTQYFKVETEPATSVRVILETVFEVMKEKIVIDGRRVIKAKNIDYEGLCW